MTTVGELDATTPWATPITDDELAALALAGDPDAPIAEDAVPYWEAVGGERDDLLPSWYMPTPMGSGRLSRPWRRRIVLLIIAAFLAIDSYGLCNTYGQLVINR